jgi:hypothetical protein
MKKIKTYNIMLSKVFPVTHERKGEPTFFSQKVQAAKFPTVYPNETPKLHTIRANYPLWEKRIAEVQSGNAEICLRQWTGKPYRSKTVEIMRLTADDGVGIQCLTFYDNRIIYPTVDNNYQPSIKEISANDGLSKDSWIEWFRGYDLSQPMAIIHFTNFRY